jgi:hypothetical protein
MRKRWRIILGVILVLSSVVLTVTAVNNYINIQEKVNSGIAAKTKGTITEHVSTKQVGYDVVTCLAKYQYTVDEIAYTEGGLSCSTVGKVSVYYDTRNPDVVLYANGLQISRDFIYLLFPLGIWIIYKGIKKYRYL